MSALSNLSHAFRYEGPAFNLTPGPRDSDASMRRYRFAFPFSVLWKRILTDGFYSGLDYHLTTDDYQEFMLFECYKLIDLSTAVRVEVWVEGCLYQKIIIQFWLPD